MAQFFDFDKERVQTITLDQLAMTHRENDVYGAPLKGIYHFQLLQDIIEMANDLNYDVEVYDMFAAQNRHRLTPGVVVLPQVEAQYGKNAVEAHILRRVFANIRIKDFDDETNTTNLAVAYHQRGIQVGFGNMVRVCHNQCMLGAEQYAATYSETGNGRSSNPLNVEDIKEVVKSWLVDARHIIVTERETIERMKSIEASAEQLFTLIGLLTSIRVKCDTAHQEIRMNSTYPLNQAQISLFTESLLLRYAKAQRVTVWDIYNAATDLYKAKGMEIPNMLPQNRAMVKVLHEHFGF